MSKEAMKLAHEALLNWKSAYPDEFDLFDEQAITALETELAKPDFWEGYVPEPVKPAQQCKWPTCQSEEYQQALAEQIKRELVGEQPAHQESETVRAAWMAGYTEGERDALENAQPVQQEPVGRLESDPDEGHVFVPRIDGDWSMLGEDLYTSPPAQRKPLTDEQIDAEFDAFASNFDHESNEWLDMGVDAYFRAGFKAAHGIKENT